MPVFRTASEEETIALGERLARTLPPGHVEIRLRTLSDDQREIELAE